MAALTNAWVSLIVKLMVKKKAPVPDSVSPAYTQKLKEQRRSVGLIQFETSADRNFVKWETLTENLVITCFGEKSNQHLQFKSLVRQLSTGRELSFEHRLDSSEFKGKIKDLLTNLIEELELKTETTVSKKSGPATLVNTRVEVTATQISIQKTEINQTISQVLENIRENAPNDEVVREAEKLLKEFEAELKKDKPTWSVIKNTLAWLLNFSREAFLQVLPILIDRYSR